MCIEPIRGLRYLEIWRLKEDLSAFFADVGRPPFLRLNSGDALLKKKNNGGGESETLGTLAIAFDDIVTEGFTFRRAQNCSHV